MSASAKKIRHEIFEHYPEFCKQNPAPARAYSFCGEDHRVVVLEYRRERKNKKRLQSNAAFD